jgi:4,5-DOPA dioxygenase extradiol
MKAEKTMPVLFVAHGAPPLIDDELWKSELAQWSSILPRPTSILMVSAHWENAPATIGATTALPLIYDFYGFPKRYYDIQYPSPGAPELAKRVRQLIPKVQEAPTRGLDHGTYIPLMFMYPEAQIPVLQLSLPSLHLPAVFDMGCSLAPLRNEGVLRVGSGFLTHNLSFLGQGQQAWALDFDAWLAEAIANNDVDALLDMSHRAPAAQLAHPRIEHYAPLAFSAGAASLIPSKPIFPVTGFWMGEPFSKRSVQYG